MVAPSRNPIQSGTANALLALADYWRRHAAVLLRATVALLALYTCLKLSTEFYRLIFDQGRFGAIDLGYRYAEVQGWFSGMDVYRQDINAMDPPASIPILWPILGWMSNDAARWLWAGLAVGALGWMTYLTIREAKPASRLEAAFVALMFLSMNATGVGIGSGQTTLYLLPFLLAGLLLLQSSRGDRLTDLAGAALVLLALVKPSITAPFVWLVLFIPRRLLPAIYVAAGYVGLTLFAASFKSEDLPTLLRGWLSNSSRIAGQGYGNVNAWLGSLGLQQYDAIVSLAILAALGVWLFLNRHGDIWLLIGVAALVSRMWMYHRVYDDIVIILPMIALFRMVKQSSAPDATAAGILLGLSVFVNLFLNSWEVYRPYISAGFTGAHTLVWLAMLGFLLVEANPTFFHREGTKARRVAGGAGEADEGAEKVIVKGHL